MSLFAPELFGTGGGPLYLQLKTRIAHAILDGELSPGESLPAERELASLTGLSRVTVRKAMQALVEQGQLVQRRGSGTFVAPPMERVEKGVAVLSSFSEDMEQRGKAVRSIWLTQGVQPPSAEEMIVLGLTTHDRVARLDRVRLADEVPLAIERAAVPAAMLPDPGIVGGSLYAALAERGLKPVRAVQRISASNLGSRDAELLGVPVGMAVLRIERVSYLRSGRAVEFTRSIYRGDAYDFTAELHLADPTE